METILADAKAADMQAAIAVHRPRLTWAGIRKCRRCRQRWRGRGCQDFRDAFAYLVIRGTVGTARLSQQPSGGAG